MQTCQTKPSKTPFLSKRKSFNQITWAHCWRSIPTKKGNCSELGSGCYRFAQIKQTSLSMLPKCYFLLGQFGTWHQCDSPTSNLLEALSQLWYPKPKQYNIINELIRKVILVPTQLMAILSEFFGWIPLDLGRVLSLIGQTYCKYVFTDFGVLFLNTRHLQNLRQPCLNMMNHQNLIEFAWNSCFEWEATG